MFLKVNEKPLRRVFCSSCKHVYCCFFFLFTQMQRWLWRQPGFSPFALRYSATVWRIPTSRFYQSCTSPASSSVWCSSPARGQNSASSGFWRTWRLVSLYKPSVNVDVTWAENIDFIFLVFKCLQNMVRFSSE